MEGKGRGRKERKTEMEEKKKILEEKGDWLTLKRWVAEKERSIDRKGEEELLGEAPWQ